MQILHKIFNSMDPPRTEREFVFCEKKDNFIHLNKKG